MPQVQLDETVFEAAKIRAQADGYPSLDALVTDLVMRHLSDNDLDETPDCDHLFTPERMA